MYAVHNISESQFYEVLEDIDDLRKSMIVALLSTIFMAMHTACAIYAVKIQIRRGLGKSGRKFLLYATASMFIATFFSWLTSILGQFQSLSIVKSDLLDEDYTLIWPIVEAYATSGALTITVVIGDSIVWWRVWVLWNKNRMILVISSLLLLACFALGVAGYFVSGGLYFTGPVGMSAIVLSLFSNMASTLLVGYKAWRHRINAKTLHFVRVSSVNKVHYALMLLFESGIVYCIIWTLVLSSEVWAVTYQHSGPSHWLWTNIMSYFIEGCLVAFVGIYPTLIIIMIALDKSRIDQECTTSFIASAGIPPASLPLMASGDASRTSETAERNMQCDTVILIGIPSSEDCDESSALKNKSVYKDDTGLVEP